MRIGTLIYIIFLSNLLLYRPGNADASPSLKTGKTPVNEDIVLICIDRLSIEFFESMKITWPFPWHVHGKVIDNIVPANPQSVYLDIFFTRHNVDEMRLAESVKRSGNVLLPCAFSTYMPDEIDQEEPGKMILFQRFGAVKTAQLPVYSRLSNLLLPLPVLMESCREVVFANAIRDRDGVVRKVPLMANFLSRVYPGVSMRLALRYLGTDMENISVGEGVITVGNVRNKKLIIQNGNIDRFSIPVDREGGMQIHFSRERNHSSWIHGTEIQWSPFKYLSYHELYRKPAQKDSLKGAIVLIGFIGKEGYMPDFHNTPVGSMAGIELHAHALNTILTNAFSLGE